MTVEAAIGGVGVLDEHEISTASQIETIPVTATVLKIQRAEIGRLLALAEVEIEIAGVVMQLHGVRVIAIGPRRRGVAAPGYRTALGRLADAVTLPPVLASAVADVVLDEYIQLRRRPSPPPSMPPGVSHRRN